MSSKSRRKRGKHSFQTKKRKDRLTPTAMATEAPATAQTYTSDTPPPASTPPVSAPASKAAPAASGYPYVTGELKRIGIIAAIMLAVLVTLSQVLP
ncbi:MAG: hypothetical protein JW790_01385 [Dehalococcoidales bacterium]|jgi:hypothetical protein|nr:hypothetical protein [Dehalococcoidales bacterium]